MEKSLLICTSLVALSAFASEGQGTEVQIPPADENFSYKFSSSSSHLEERETTKTISNDHWNGQEYRANSAPQQRRAEGVINRIPFNGSERVLDIGCGDGRISLFLAEKLNNGGSVLGVDSSESMYAETQKLQVHKKIPNLSFMIGDAQQLSFQNEFDMITGFSFFQWVEDKETALRNFNNALKPGGKVYLYFNPDHGRKVHIDDSISYVMSLPKWNHYLKDKKSSIYMSSPRQLTELIERSDFLLEKMEIVLTEDKFENKEACIQWIFGWMDSLKFIPDNQRHPFVTEIVDDYVRKVGISSDGSFILYDYMMELVLQKK